MTDDGTAPATHGANVLFDSAMVLLDKLALSQKHYRILQRGLVISVALDIILSIALMFVFAGQVNLNSAFRVAQQRQNTTLNTKLVKACQDINTNKANDIKLWNELLLNTIPVVPNESKAELALQAKFHALINVRDQPVNCIARYGGK